MGHGCWSLIAASGWPLVPLGSPPVAAGRFLASHRRHPAVCCCSLLPFFSDEGVPCPAAGGCAAGAAGRRHAGRRCRRRRIRRRQTKWSGSQCTLTPTHSPGRSEVERLADSSRHAWAMLVGDASCEMDSGSRLQCSAAAVAGCSRALDDAGCSASTTLQSRDGAAAVRHRG